MRRLKKFSALLLAAGLVFGLTGCDQPNNGGGGGGRTWIDDIDWRNHGPANHGFITDNLSAHRLVTFHGHVHPNTVLGGVPPNADNHGIFRDPAVFNSTRSIHVVVVREDELIYHYNNNTLNLLNANPFVSLMVLYNHGMANNHRHRLTQRAGGRHRLIVANPTQNNVELRINSPLAGGGDVLGFSPRLSLSTVFHLNDHVFPTVETLIFPVFRFFHPVDQTVSEIFPQFGPGTGILEGTPWFMPLATAAGLPDVNSTINIQTVMSDFHVRLGAVWLVVENTTGMPITFFQGQEAMPDSMGAFQIPGVMPHNRRTMVFNARGVGGGAGGGVGGPGQGQILPHLEVGNLGVGATVAVRTNDVRAEDGSTNFQLRSDHLYRVRVSGSIGAFVATIDLEGEPIDVQQLMQQGQ